MLPLEYRILQVTSLGWYYLGSDGSHPHYSLCFSSNDNNHYTNFVYQVQTMLVYYLKANHSHVII